MSTNRPSENQDFTVFAPRAEQSSQIIKARVDANELDVNEFYLEYLKLILNENNPIALNQVREIAKEYKLYDDFQIVNNYLSEYTLVPDETEEERINKHYNELEKLFDTDSLKKINNSNVTAKAAEILCRKIPVLRTKAVLEFEASIEFNKFNNAFVNLSKRFSNKQVDDKNSVTDQNLIDTAKNLLKELYTFLEFSERKNPESVKPYLSLINKLICFFNNHTSTTRDDDFLKAQEKANEELKLFRQQEKNQYTVGTLPDSDFAVNSKEFDQQYPCQKEADAIVSSQEFKIINNFYNNRKQAKKTPEEVSEKAPPLPRTVSVENLRQKKPISTSPIISSAHHSQENLGLKHFEKIPPQAKKTKRGFWATYGDEIGAMVITWTAAGAGLGATIGAFGGLAVFGLGAIPGAGIGAGLGATIGAVGGLIAGVGVAFVASVSAKKAAKESRVDSISKVAGEEPGNKPNKGKTLGSRQEMEKRFLGDPDNNSNPEGNNNPELQIDKNSFSHSNTEESGGLHKGIEEFKNQQASTQAPSAAKPDEERASKREEEHKSEDDISTNPPSARR